MTIGLNTTDQSSAATVTKRTMVNGNKLTTTEFIWKSRSYNISYKQQAGTIGLLRFYYIVHALIIVTFHNLIAHLISLC